jgi:hypothetical protein
LYFQRTRGELIRQFIFFTYHMLDFNRFKHFDQQQNLVI